MNNSSRRNALVVLSGGQDSTTCLAWAIPQYHAVLSVTFNYGQRHAIEIERAKLISKMAGVLNTVIDMPGVLGGSSPLVNPDEKVETYASAEVLPGGLEKTFVPGRNALMLTVAASHGYVKFNGQPFDLITGVSQEDFGGYPDCREEFILSMEKSLNLALYLEGEKLRIITPLIHLNKMQTVELATQLPNAMELLAYSWTCYKGGIPSAENPDIMVPCGQCHACLLRKRGFANAGVLDPALEVYSPVDWH